MRRKESGIDALYDIRAVRILVDDVKDCYAALGIVHDLWTPLPRRVRRLHREAQGQRLPLAAHRGDRARRQAAGSADPHARDAPALGVRRRRALALQGRRQAARARPGVRRQDRLAAPGARLEGRGRRRRRVARSSSRAACSPTRSTCSRRRARWSTCRAGATPVDFAYAVHTTSATAAAARRSTARWCRSTTRCRTAQRVEIVAAKQGGPSRDWLNPELGYVHSHRARAKVRQWFKAQQHEETLAQGRAIVERELQRAGATALKPRRAWRRRRASPSSTNSSPRSRAPSSTCGSCSGDPARSRTGRSRARAGESDAGGRRAAEQGGRRGQRHPDRRRRPADDGARALLQAGAARSDRRLRHARQGHLDPPPQLQQRRAHARARARAADRRRIGARRATRCSRSTSWSRRWTGRACCATSPKCSRARRST